MTARSCCFFSESTAAVLFPHKYPSLLALVRSISASTIFLPISLPPKHSFRVSKPGTQTTKPQIPVRRSDNSLASEVPQLVLHRQHLRELQSGAIVRADQEILVVRNASTRREEGRRDPHVAGILLEETGQDRPGLRVLPQPGDGVKRKHQEPSLVRLGSGRVRSELGWGRTGRRRRARRGRKGKP